jgi:hypothetical protein
MEWPGSTEPLKRAHVVTSAMDTASPGSHSNYGSATAEPQTDNKPQQWSPEPHPKLTSRDSTVQEQQVNDPLVLELKRPHHWCLALFVLEAERCPRVRQHLHHLRERARGDRGRWSRDGVNNWDGEDAGTARTKQPSDCLSVCCAVKAQPWALL